MDHTGRTHSSGQLVDGIQVKSVLQTAKCKIFYMHLLVVCLHKRYVSNQFSSIKRSELLREDIE